MGASYAAESIAYVGSCAYKLTAHLLRLLHGLLHDRYFKELARFYFRGILSYENYLVDSGRVTPLCLTKVTRPGLLRWG
jgi:hypothetical protein